jgi:putative transcriptional regulator
MPIIIRLDRVIADRKISQVDLAEKIGLAPMNLSRIKTGKIKAIRLSTLERLCRELNCQPGDLLEYMTEEAAERAGFFHDDR